MDLVDGISLGVACILRDGIVAGDVVTCILGEGITGMGDFDVGIAVCGAVKETAGFEVARFQVNHAKNPQVANIIAAIVPVKDSENERFGGVDGNS